MDKRQSRRRSDAAGGGRAPEAAPEQRSGIEDVVGDCALYERGRRVPGGLGLEKAGEAAGNTTGFVWIGLQGPAPADVEAVADTFDLPSLAVEDAVKAHQRPKLEQYGDVLFLVLKPVTYVDSEEVIVVDEIAVFLGKNYAVTVRHGSTDVLAHVREELDAGGKDLERFGAAGVLYKAADLVVDSYEEALSAIEDDIAEIEAQVFSPEGGDRAERIYKLKREVLEFRRAVTPLAAPLERLAAGSVPGIPEALRPYFRDVHDHVLRAAEVVDAHDRLLTDVLQANLARVNVRQSAVAVRQNEDMRKISAWAAIALVPTAIAGVYGMNFENMPELKWEHGYYLVLALMLSACTSLYLLFRKNGWL